MAVSQSAKLDRRALERRMEELGPWFHNMQLDGVATAPDHFLGDYPEVKYAHFHASLPANMSGLTVLDIGCNGGFYSLEMKRQGALRVLDIDTDEHYLRQARFAAEVSDLEIDFERMAVWEMGALGERFDLVIFMGVDLLLFQSMQRGSPEIAVVAEDYDFIAPTPFDKPGDPKMHFIEHRFSHDETNWWVPNRACTEAMLRSSGFAIESQPEDEVYVCRWRRVATPPDGPHCVHPSGTSTRP